LLAESLSGKLQPADRKPGHPQDQRAQDQCGTNCRRVHECCTELMHEGTSGATQQQAAESVGMRAHKTAVSSDRDAFRVRRHRRIARLELNSEAVDGQRRHRVATNGVEDFEDPRCVVVLDEL
jgi:hypothetical protein